MAIFANFLCYFKIFGTPRKILRNTCASRHTGWETLLYIVCSIFFCKVCSPCQSLLLFLSLVLSLYLSLFSTFRSLFFLKINFNKMWTVCSLKCLHLKLWTTTKTIDDHFSYIVIFIEKFKVNSKKDVPCYNTQIIFSRIRKKSIKV